LALLQSLERPVTAAERDPTPVGELSVSAVYDAHFDFAWRVLRRLGVTRQQLEDAVQDVFVVVQRRLADFEGRSSLKTWLFGIALRVSKDYRRRSRKSGVQIALDDELVGTAHDPEDAALEVEAAAVVQTILDQLDEARRDVFVMIELEELTPLEAATLLGLSVNAVHSRLRLARRDAERAFKRYRARSERT
jgi:RNA polymerase sigma-70 factor, ECF subfamily